MTQILKATTLYLAQQKLNASAGIITTATLSNRKRLCKEFEAFFGSLVTLDQKLNYNSFITSKLQSCLPVTVKGYVQTLRHFLNWCHYEGLVSAPIILPKIRYKHKRRGAFTYTQLKIILRWARENDDLLYYYILFLVLTGSRPGKEALSVKWVDIIFCKYPIITFPHSKTTSGHSIARPAFNFFFKKYCITHPKNGGKLLFPITPGAISQRFSRMLKSLNLLQDDVGNNLAAYSLRHFYITHLIKKGVNPYAIATNCRTSLNMISMSYSHVKASDFGTTLYGKGA